MQSPRASSPLNAAYLGNRYIPTQPNMIAPSTLPTLALLTISYIAYRLIKSLITNRRFRKFAKQHGCKAPLDTTGSFPYGWDTVYRLM